MICDGRSPFEINAAVRGMGGRAARLRLAAPSARRQSGITRANARALVDEWIALNSAQRRRSPGGREVIARRVISWLSQAPLLLDDADVQFYRRFLRSLTRQVPLPAPYGVANARDGVPRLQVAIALTYAALCMARPAAAHPRRHQAARRGAGSARSCPTAAISAAIRARCIELLLDLLPLRTAFTARNIAPPPPLLNAIDRMMPMLRFFRHGDGNFALFNGMGPDPDRPA